MSAKKGVPQPRIRCPECRADLPRNLITQHRWFKHKAGKWAENGLPFHLRPTRVEPRPEKRSS